MRLTTALLIAAGTALTLAPSVASATEWTYDFGTGTGSLNAGASAQTSTTLLTAPGGTDYVRVGTAGGSVALLNPGDANLGSGSELVITAPTTASVNKASIYDYTASTAYALSFSTVLSGNLGTFSVMIGDGATYSNANAFSSTEVATGFKFVLGGTSGSPTVTTTYRSGGSWVSTNLTTSGLVANTVLDLKVFGNNQSSGSLTYYIGSTAYTVAAGTWDFWLGSTLIGNDLAKGGLTAGGNIDSFMFYGESSTGSVGKMAIDNLVYANSLPALAVTPGNYWAPGASGGGAGTWSSASNVWATASGSQGAGSQASSGALIFTDTAGTVTVSGTVTANAGLTFSADAYALTGGTVTLGGANAAANTITTDTAVGASIGSTLSASNGLTKAGNGILTLGGSNTLGAVAVSAGTLKLGNASALGSTASGTSVAAGATLDLNGLAVGAEALALSGTLANSSATAASLSGLVTASGSAAIATTGNLTLSGGTAGTGSLTKSGNASLTLTGATAHSGGTTVSAGTLATSGSGTLTGNVTLASGTTLQLAGATTLGTLSAANSTLNLTFGGALATTTLNLDGTLSLSLLGLGATPTVGNYQVLTFSSLTGAGSISFSQSLEGYGLVGTLNADNYSVAITLLAKSLSWSGSAGTWSVGGGNWTNDGTSGAESFTNGDQVTFGSGGAGGTGGEITVGAGVTFGSLAFTSPNLNYTLTGDGLGGSGYVVLSGGGTVTLNNANTFTGTVAVNAGTLVAGNASALGATSAGTSVAAGAELYLANGITISGEALSLAGALRGSNATNTYAGAITLAAAAELGSQGTLNVSGAISGAGQALSVTSGDVNLSGGLTAASLSKSGNGTLTISAASTLSGTTLGAGTINLDHATALGNGTLTINGGALGNTSGADKALANAVSVGGNFALGTASSNGALTLSGAVDLGGASRTVSVTGSHTLSGAITNGSFTKSGNGTLTLSGSNTLGGLTVAAGTLRMGSANALGGSSATVDSGATLQLNGQNATLTSLSGSGTVANGAAANSTLTLNVASSASVSAAFSDGAGGGKLGLTKSGNGALALNTASTNSGAVAISKGSVAANASAALGSGSVFLAAGATLAAGNGTSHANAITIGATSLTENFNALASGLPTGWTVRTGATASALGTTVTPLTAATDWGTGAGSNTSGNFRNAASVGSGLASNASFADQAAATDRALASRLTGSFGDPGAAFVYQFSTLGQTLQGLSVDVQMLSVQTRSNTWTLQVASGAAPTSWTTLGTYTDPGAFGSTTLSYDAAALASIANQETAWFRMATLSASTSTGSRDTVGIDNFTLLYGGTNAVLGVTDIDSVASFSGGLTLSGSANLTAASGSDATFSGAISGAGAITKVGAGRVILSGNNAGFSGGITVTAGTLELGSASALGSGAVTVQGGELNFGGYGYSGTVNLAGGTLGGGGNLIETAIISVNTGATLTLSSSGALNRATIKVNGGTLDLGGLDGSNIVNFVSGTLLGASNWLGLGSASGSGDVTSAIAALAGAGVSIQLTAGQSANLAGISADVVLNGGSVTALTGFTGDLRVDSGTVNLSSVSGLSSYSGSIEVRTGATVDFGSTASAVAINYVGGTVAGSAYTGTVTVGSTISLALGSGNVASGATILALAGSLIDAGGGTNAVIYTGGSLTGLDTFTGSLTVDDTKLVRNGLINTAVTLASGGALGGGVQINGNLVQQAGSILAPGNSPGLVQVGGNHTLVAGASLELEVMYLPPLSVGNPTPGTDHDAVRVFGTLDLSGLDAFNRYIIQLTSIDDASANKTAYGFATNQGFQLTVFETAGIYLGSNTSVADLFDIRTNTSGLAFLDEDGVTPIDASRFSIYQDGNNLVLAYAPIPEPSTYGLMLGGLALAGAAIRRRRAAKNSK